MDRERAMSGAMALAFIHPLFGVWLAMGMVMMAGWQRQEGAAAGKTTGR